MREVRHDHFPVAWAISYRDYYGHYPSYRAGPILNSKTMGQGPGLMDKRLAIISTWCLKAGLASFENLWGPGGNFRVFHSSKDMWG